MSVVTESTLQPRFAANPQPIFARGFRTAAIWPARRQTGMSMRARPSGNASLDALLPGGGWPLGGLTEILVDGPDGRELGLLLPALAALTQARRRVAIIGSPTPLDRSKLSAAGVNLDFLVQIDFSVTDAHWNAEQYLCAGGCAAVVVWESRGDYRQLRNLQLAAEGGTALAFVFHPPAMTIDRSSPAVLQLKLSKCESGSHIEILKCRGIHNT